MRARRRKPRPLIASRPPAQPERRLISSELGLLYCADDHVRDLQKGISHLHRALELKPNDLETMNNLGSYYLADGNANLARDLWQRALAVAPDHQAARQNLKSLEK